MADNKGEKASGNFKFGPGPWTLWFKDHMALVLFGIGILAACFLSWFFMPIGHKDDASNRTAQKTLESSLAAAENNRNDTQIVNITGQLIDGQKSGIYDINNETLAKYHMARATSNINLNQLKPVAKDCEAAAALSAQYKLVALQFEFESRYKLGERQQLIPTINKIVDIEKSSTNPMRGSVIAQYQDYISDIQQNKEISLE